MTREEKKSIIAGVSSCVKHKDDLFYIKDFDIEINGLSVSVFWHSPTLNIGWYPIVQIENDSGIILHREGPEIHEGWEEFIDYVCKFINDNIEEK